MPTPSSLLRSIFIVHVFLLEGNLNAQNNEALHRFDAKMDAFFAAEQRDSFIYYAEAKAKLAKQADSLALWAQTLIDIHETFGDDYQKALAQLNTVWANRWRDPKVPEEWKPFTLLFANKGWFLNKLGQYWQANQAYDTAAQCYERFRFENFNLVGSIYKPLGINYTRLGENDKAIAIYQKAIAIKGENESLSGLYANMGIAYWNKGDYTTAENYYRIGLSLSGISNAKRGLLLCRMAETMLDLGRTPEAARSSADAIRLLRPEGPKDPALKYRAHARRIAGDASTRMGKFAEADRLISGALADDRAASGDSSREVGKDYIAFSNLYLKKGQASQAIQAADRALAAVIPSFKPKSGDNPSTNRPFTNPPVTSFYEENTIFEALTAKAAAAHALFEKSGDTRWLELALECHQLAYQAESILRQVFQYSSSKLNLQKGARAREEAAMAVARLLFEKTGQAIWFEKAFAIAERSKAALLLEALQDNLVRLRLSGSDKRLDELAALRQNLSHFDKNQLLHPNSDEVPQWRIDADVIRTKIATIENNLRTAYPSLSGLENNTVNWLPTAGDFSEGEALVEYFMSEHWIDVFVFQKDKSSSQVWHRIPNDTALQGLIHRYLAYFENDFAILNDPDGYFQTAHTLWQKLIPVETGSAALLTILPDGILNFVPFEALITSMDVKGKFEQAGAKAALTLHNASYLLRQQEVRYAWSLAVLRQQKHLKSKASNYLLSIAPGFNNHERNLSPLAAANFDWGGITGWNVQHLKGQAADFHHFLKAAGEYRVLHFYTHAFASGNPRIELMDSSLLLPDLYALPLQADLVMLSACQTGLGQEEKGEGVMSLARAFAQAGAACIVSSLWSVNDQSTSRLLRYFYEKIGQGHTSSAALREAKLAYLSDSEVGSAAQSPYFWAGLVAVGDDRVIEQPWGWGVMGVVTVILLLIGWLWWKRIYLLKSFK